jgi:hypothetical protein
MVVRSPRLGKREVITTKSQIKLGTVFGVELGLHYSWLVIALLITFSLFCPKLRQYLASPGSFQVLLIWQFMPRHRIGAHSVLDANVKPGKTALVVMSRHASRQKLAREFGATDIVTERGDEGVAHIKELTKGSGGSGLFLSRQRPICAASDSTFAANALNERAGNI